MRKELQQDFQNEKKPENRWKLVMDQAIRKRVRGSVCITWRQLFNPELILKKIILQREASWWHDLPSPRALPKRASTLRKRSCCSIVTRGSTSTSVKGWTICWRVPSVSIPKPVSINVTGLNQHGVLNAPQTVSPRLLSLSWSRARAHFCSHGP